MPVGFCFIIPNTNDNETLAVIDDKAAIFFGKTPDPKYAPFMDMISDFGVGILTRMGGGEVTEEIFNKWYADIHAKEPDRVAKMHAYENDKLFECLRKFLYQDYTFRAWR